MLATKAMLELEELKLNNCGLGVGGGQIIGSGLEDLDALIREANLEPKLRVLGAVSQTSFILFKTFSIAEIVQRI